MIQSKRTLLQLIRAYNDGHSGDGADPCELLLLTEQSARTLKRNTTELARDGLIERTGVFRFVITAAGRDALNEGDAS